MFTLKLIFLLLLEKLSVALGKTQVLKYLRYFNALSWEDINHANHIKFYLLMKAIHFTLFIHKILPSSLEYKIAFFEILYYRLLSLRTPLRTYANTLKAFSTIPPCNCPHWYFTLSNARFYLSGKKLQ